MNFLNWFKNFFSSPNPPPPPRPENTGVILGNQPTDYFVGAKGNPIIYQSRLKDGNWFSFCWSKVVQWCFFKGLYIDLMNCVTNAIITAIETQEFWLTGIKVKYSRRWIAKMSGTTKEGNYLYKVMDTIREYGLILEEDYPTPPTFTWDSYYQDILDPLLSQLKSKGQAWLKTRGGKDCVQYEFLTINDSNIDYHLKHAPVVVVIPGHAVCGIYSPNEYIRYRDSYEPFDKQTPDNAQFLQSAMKVIYNDARIIIRNIGWTDKEKGKYIGFDTPERELAFNNALLTLFPDYRLENREWNLGKRPF